jgi:hypothetical protein
VISVVCGLFSEEPRFYQGIESWLDKRGFRLYHASYGTLTIAGGQVYMLKELHVKHVGPARAFDIEFGPRLNVFTGDNGLQENGNTLYNGLIDDWVRWQYQPNQNATSPFAILYSTRLQKNIYSLWQWDKDPF